MKKIRFLILTMIVAIVFTGCSEDTIGVELRGSLEGTVTDEETGDPLEGVTITTNPASTTVLTEADGTFSIPVITVDDYSVQAELDEYQTGFEPITITENNTSVVLIELSISQGTNLTPAVPELINPEDNAIDVPLEVDFLWTSSVNDDDDITYTLELRNGATSELQAFEVEQDTTFTVSNLQTATNYFWQVKASDGENDEVSSALNTFTTLTLPNNPFLFVKEEEGNNVIFSGNEDPNTQTTSNPDFNVIQLTSSSTNSFNPKKNNQVNKIAFLRTIGSETHLFTMDLDGRNVRQVTNSVPVGGFRLSELDFTWANNGGRLFYPNFGRVYSIDPDGGDATPIYTSTDGNIISEVAVPEFDQDLLLLKTNNASGYDVRIFTYRRSSGTEEKIILDNMPGAAGGIDITASGNRVLFSRDVSGEENPNYRLFESRIFIYEIPTDELKLVVTEVISGENDLDPSFSPSEGGMIWTRRLSNPGSVPNVYSQVFSNNENDKLLFTEAFMPDWE